VASLEDKLKTTSKALKDADAARTSADKAAKAAEAKASKAEKALADVAHKNANREGAIIKQLDAIVKALADVVSSSSCLSILLHFYLSTYFSCLICIFVMQQNILERS
jgi:Skp family chaperone for outer membrane proteins